jgi:hypothetical protein
VKINVRITPPENDEVDVDVSDETGERIEATAE